MRCLSHRRVAVHVGLRACATPSCTATTHPTKPLPSLVHRPTHLFSVAPCRRRSASALTRVGCANMPKFWGVASTIQERHHRGQSRPESRAPWLSTSCARGLRDTLCAVRFKVQACLAQPVRCGCAVVNQQLYELCTNNGNTCLTACCPTCF